MAPAIYLQKRAQLLGAEVLQRQRIYLDMNYWAQPRQHVSGQRIDAAVARLLELLRKSVRDRR